MMRALILVLACACFGTTAWAQCNPSIPGTCTVNDPALLGQQQLQENRATQRLEMMQQNLQLQQIQRENTQRYEQQQHQILRDRGGLVGGVPQIVTVAPTHQLRHGAAHHRVRVAPRHRRAPAHRSGRQRGAAARSR